MLLSLKIRLCALVLLVFIGCTGSDGIDGKDGKAFIGLSWLYTPLYYNDNNSSTPFTVYKEHYYRSAPGTYIYQYIAWNGYEWIGQYKIYVDRGDQGKSGGWFWRDGADGTDGDDICFTLFCYSIGPTLRSNVCNSYVSDNSTKELEIQMIHESGIQIEDNPISLSGYNYFNIKDIESILSYGTTIEEGHIGKYYYKHIYKRIK